MRLVAKIELDFPIKLNGAEISTITMRRPKTRDDVTYARSGKDVVDRNLDLYASLCEMTPDEILELDSTDYDKLEDQYRSFKGRRSPETS